MDLRVDNTGELVLANGDVATVEDTAAIEQALRLSLRTLKGEWFLNRSVGVPYVQSIFVKPARVHAVAAILRAAVLAVPGVTEVRSLAVDFDPSDRSISVSFEAVTPTGQMLTFSEFIL